MKSLLELYTMLLENFKDNPNHRANKLDAFICHSIDELKITSEERDLLMEHFKDEKPSPTKHTAFYEHELYVGGNNRWFWILFNNVRNPELCFSLRVQLLTNIIAELKDGSN